MWWPGTRSSLGLLKVTAFNIKENKIYNQQKAEGLVCFK